MNSLKLALVAVIAMASLPAFSYEKASQAEKTLLCEAVSQWLTVTAADVALDETACKNNQEVESKLVTEGVRAIYGQLTFRRPKSANVKALCTVSYTGGVATLDNVFEGIEVGVRCGDN